MMIFDPEAVSISRGQPGGSGSVGTGAAAAAAGAAAGATVGAVVVGDAIVVSGAGVGAWVAGAAVESADCARDIPNATGEQDSRMAAIAMTRTRLINNS
jgi:hypothetical protein